MKQATKVIPKVIKGVAKSKLVKSTIIREGVPLEVRDKPFLLASDRLLKSKFCYELSAITHVNYKRPALYFLVHVPTAVIGYLGATQNLTTRLLSHNLEAQEAHALVQKEKVFSQKGLEQKYFEASKLVELAKIRLEDMRLIALPQPDKATAFDNERELLKDHQIPLNSQHNKPLLPADTIEKLFLGSNKLTEEEYNVLDYAEQEDVNKHK